MGNHRLRAARLLPFLAFLGWLTLPNMAQAQDAYETCAFSDSTHCIGIGPGTSGQAYVSNGPSAYPSFSSSIPGVTSVGGVTIPATASEFVTAPTTTTASQCFLSTTTAGLGSWGNCPASTPAGLNGQIQYNNSGSLGGIASSGTAGYPLLDGGTGVAAFFGTLNLSLTIGGALTWSNPSSLASGNAWLYEPNALSGSINASTAGDGTGRVSPNYLVYNDTVAASGTVASIWVHPKFLSGWDGYRFGIGSYLQATAAPVSSGVNLVSGSFLANLG